MAQPRGPKGTVEGFAEGGDVEAALATAARIRVTRDDTRWLGPFGALFSGLLRGVPRDLAVLQVAGQGAERGDAESGQPIRTSRWLSSARPPAATSLRAPLTYLSPRETRSGPDGPFIIGGSLSPAPCLAFDWVESVRILAPGYFEEVFPGPTFPAAI